MSLIYREQKKMMEILMLIGILHLIDSPHYEENTSLGASPDFVGAYDAQGSMGTPPFRVPAAIGEDGTSYLNLRFRQGFKLQLQ